MWLPLLTFLAKPEVPGMLQDGPPLNRLPSLVESAMLTSKGLEGEVTSPKLWLPRPIPSTGPREGTTSPSTGLVYEDIPNSAETQIPTSERRCKWVQQAGVKWWGMVVQANVNVWKCCQIFPFLKRSHSRDFSVKFLSFKTLRKPNQTSLRALGGLWTVSLSALL